MKRSRNGPGLLVYLLLMVAPQCSVSGTALAQPLPVIPPPAGPHVKLTPQDFAQAWSFHSTDRLVMTYYFYWYDSHSKAHLLNPDGSDALTDHPASLDDFSYKSVRWHKKQLRDMEAAGIDVVLPVYWGAPSLREPAGATTAWPFAGLPPLARAADELVREGRRPPRVGLFYDTSTLRNDPGPIWIDLTTAYGKRWFYSSIRDFFSLVPPRHWALIDGRPIIVLFSAVFAKAYDQSCIDYVRRHFARDFGGLVPYIVHERSWKLHTENSYSWGGALQPSIHGVAALGPGYDHSHVPGRKPFVVPRLDGKFYEMAWLSVLHYRPRIVALETWNEFHESTDLCESREYGRQYIELTRKYTDRFKRGLTPFDPRRGRYSGAASVQVLLGRENRAHGLRQVEPPDGVTAPVRIGPVEARAVRGTSQKPGYMYFLIAASFKEPDATDVTVEVEYFDGGPGSFGLAYDSYALVPPFNGAYRQAGQPVALQGSRRWRTARFTLPEARFGNFENGGADFRLYVVNADLFAVRRVVVRRVH